MRTLLQRLLIISLLIPIQHSVGDTITMKNGDVFRATVLKQDFGNFVQILFKDGNEKRLLWPDIASIQSDPVKPEEPQSIPQTSSENRPSETNSDEFPSEMLDYKRPFRFEFDLIGVSYDTTWQQVSLQGNGSSTSTNANVSNHYVRTVPLEFNLAAYLGHWHTYLNFLNAIVNNNDVSDDSFTTLSVAYGINRYFDLGIFVNLQYANTSDNSATASTVTTGSSYGFGPQFHLVLPVSNFVAIESSVGAGLSFRNLTIGNSTASLIGSGTAFLSILHLGISASISRQVSFVAWADGWIYLGSLDGTVLSSGQSVAGTLQDDVYRLRVVPIGLRIKF